ncbi:MAG: hypothetical protein JNG84_08100 [Archangium sp.]|nr:hypothetical protein [Archangium sp.]
MTSRPVTSELARAEPVTLTPAQALENIARARARARAELDALAQRKEPLERLTAVARRHPLAAVGLAVVVGYAVARLLSGPRRRSR